MVQNVCNMVWFLLKQVCISKYNTKLIFVKFMRFYGIYLIIKRPVFKSCILPCQALEVDRDGRSDRSTDVHETCTKAKLAWPVDRLKLPHSRVGAVDQAVDHKHWPGRPGGRPEGSTVDFLTVGRSTGRGKMPFSAANGQIPNGVINTPKNFKSKISPIYKCFNTSFQKSF